MPKLNALELFCRNINFLVNDWQANEYGIQRLKFNADSNLIEIKEQDDPISSEQNYQSCFLVDGFSNLTSRLYALMIGDDYRYEVNLFRIYVEKYIRILNVRVGQLHFPDLLNTTMVDGYKDMSVLQAYISLTLAIRGKSVDIQGWINKNSSIYSSELIIILKSVIYELDLLILSMRTYQLKYFLNTNHVDTLRDFSHYRLRAFALFNVEYQNVNFTIDYGYIPQKINLHNHIHIWDYFPTNGEIIFKMYQSGSFESVAEMTVSMNWEINKKNDFCLIDTAQYLKFAASCPLQCPQPQNYILHFKIVKQEKENINLSKALDVFFKMARDMTRYNNAQSFFLQDENIMHIKHSDIKPMEEMILSEKKAMLPLYLGIGKARVPSFSAIRARAQTGKLQNSRFQFNQAPFNIEIIRNREMLHEFGQTGQQDWCLPAPFLSETTTPFYSKDNKLSLWKP